MVRFSERKVLLNELGSLLKQLITDDLDGTVDFSELSEIYEGLSNSRYLNTRKAIPNSDAIRNLIWNLPDKEFKILARCDPDSFEKYNI